MPITQLLGWIGNIGFVCGGILVARRNISGFVLQILANGLYVGQSIIMKNYPLLCLSIILIGTNGYGIYNWTKKRKNCRDER